MKRCTTEEPEDNDNLPARLPDNLTLRKTFFRKCEISSLEFLVTICILISCQISTISPKPEPNFPTQTHLWPGARAPVSGAGDVCVAGGHWLRFGHVFALAWLQGFLLISTHCLDAEHRPFSLSRSPTARRAFLPLSEPPAAQRDAKVHDWIVHLCWKITILYSCGNAEDWHRHTFRWLGYKLPLPFCRNSSYTLVQHNVCEDKCLKSGDCHVSPHVKMLRVRNYLNLFNSKKHQKKCRLNEAFLVKTTHFILHKVCPRPPECFVEAPYTMFPIMLCCQTFRK